MVIAELVNSPSQADYFDPKTFAVFLRSGQPLDTTAIEHLERTGLLQTELSLHAPPPVVSDPPPRPAPPLQALPRPTSTVYTARRKNPTSYARIVLGAPSIQINNQSLSDYFADAPAPAHQALDEFFRLSEVKSVLGRMTVNVRIFDYTDSLTRHANAVVHCIAWALVHYDTEKFKPLFRLHNLAGFRSYHLNRES